MSRVLALCLDYNASVTDGHRELSASNNNTANGEIPFENAVLEEVSPDDRIDRHSMVDLENVPAEIDQAQVLPPSTPIFPKPHDQQVESSAAGKMILTLPYHNLVSTSSPPRSKVLLVEDNVINMKAFLTLPSSSRYTNSERSRFSCSTCKKQSETTWPPPTASRLSKGSKQIPGHLA